MVRAVSANQGPYLASGDQPLDRATGEHASVHEYPGELGQPPGLYPSNMGEADESHSTTEQLQEIVCVETAAVV